MVTLRPPLHLGAPLRAMLHSTAATPARALGCIVYISEGRDAAALARLEAVARSSGPAVALASLFVDAPYNRSNFCLVGRSEPQLAAAAAALAGAALGLIDLRQHGATHPRLGVVDHISCHPLLGQESRGPERQQQQLEAAASLARAIGAQLGEIGGSSREGKRGGVPVFLYGSAHPQRRPLADIRRALGYFRGAAQGHWEGAIEAGSNAGAASPPLLPLAQDYGPPAAPLRSGVCCVGASPWIVNFNVLVEGLSDFEAARRIARAASERGGGLRGLQAMALQHGDALEIACNILDQTASPQAAVEARIGELAAAEGGAVKSSYRIGRAPEELLELALQLPS